MLLRVDADPASGAGHAMRCLALAQAWRDAGGEAVMAMSSGGAALAPRLKREGISLEDVVGTPGGREDIAGTRALAERSGARWLVVDGYWVSSGYVREATPPGAGVLWIDDAGDQGLYTADVVLNQNLHATDTPYRREGAAPALLLGPRFALLRRELLHGGDAPREIPAVASRILVTLGGSDPVGATGWVIRALRPLAPEAELQVLVGAANPRAAEIEEEARLFGSAARVLRGVEDVGPLLAWADLAISAAGSTSWELCRFGVPFVTLVIAENQEPIAASLAAAGVACNAGWHDRLDSQRLCVVVSELAADAFARRRMSESGRALVDGRGAARVVERLRAARAA